MTMRLVMGLFIHRCAADHGADDHGELDGAAANSGAVNDGEKYIDC